MRAAVVTLIGGLLLSASAQAATPEPVETQTTNLWVTGAKASFDVVILRPLGLIALVVGAGAFVPTAVVASPMGWDGIEPAMNFFVVEPAKQVFQRPLGDF